MDAWSYNHSLMQIRPAGVKPIGVNMDAGGLDPHCLNQMLTNWDVDVRGCARYVGRPNLCESSVRKRFFFDALGRPRLLLQVRY